MSWSFWHLHGQCSSSDMSMWQRTVVSWGLKFQCHLSDGDVHAIPNPAVRKYMYVLVCTEHVHVWLDAKRRSQFSNLKLYMYVGNQNATTDVTENITSQTVHQLHVLHVPCTCVCTCTCSCHFVKAIFKGFSIANKTGIHFRIHHNYIPICPP